MKKYFYLVLFAAVVAASSACTQTSADQGEVIVAVETTKRDTQSENTGILQDAETSALASAAFTQEQFDALIRTFEQQYGTENTTAALTADDQTGLDLLRNDPERAAGFCVAGLFSEGALSDERIANPFTKDLVYAAVLYSLSAEFDQALFKDFPDALLWCRNTFDHICALYRERELQLFDTCFMQNPIQMQFLLYGLSDPSLRMTCMTPFDSEPALSSAEQALFIDAQNAMIRYLSDGTEDSQLSIVGDTSDLSIFLAPEANWEFSHPGANCFRLSLRSGEAVLDLSYISPASTN